MANLGRRSSPGTGPGWAEPGEPGRKACSQGSHWFPLRFNQGSGVRWRGRLLGPVLSVAELRPSLALLVYDVFLLLSYGLYFREFSPVNTNGHHGAMAGDELYDLAVSGT
jgi:hypothetical protein